MSGKASIRSGFVASFVAAACWGAVARAAEPLAHFQCYHTRGDSEVDRTVTLTDQFGQIEARIEQLTRLCIPADTNGNTSAAARPERLTQWTIRPIGGHVEPRYVSVTNELGTVVLELRHHLPARSVLVPSAFSSTPPAPGQPAPGAVSNFACYHVHPDPARVIEHIELADEMGTQRLVTTRPEELCSPVKVDDEDVVDPATHLLCYTVRRVQAPPAARIVHSTDEFGSGAVRMLTHLKQRLCVPSTVIELP